jgi:uncharacterized protein with HEPN domain
MKDKIPIAIVGVVISAVTAFAVVQTKVGALEKQSDKIETSMESLKDFRAEQRIVNQTTKEDLSEVKEGLKEILKEVRALK